MLDQTHLVAQPVLGAVYTFRAIARMYYPHVAPETASRCLRRLVHGDPLIMQEFRRSGYRLRQRRLTPRQVHCLLEVLGTPSEFVAYNDFVVGKPVANLLA